MASYWMSHTHTYMSESSLYGCIILDCLISDKRHTLKGHLQHLLSKLRCHLICVPVFWYMVALLQTYVLAAVMFMDMQLALNSIEWQAACPPPSLSTSLLEWMILEVALRLTANGHPCRGSLINMIRSGNNFCGKFVLKAIGVISTTSSP